MMTGIAARAGAEMPSRPTDILSFWRDWTSRGYFDWEADGYPYWSATHHLNSWWRYRHLPNILFVHFNDLLADLPGEVGRIGSFLNVPLTPGRAEQIADVVTFDSMKSAAEVVNPGAHFGFVGGPATFINKGTNGRWRDVLGPAELDLYGPMLLRLPPDAARWLQQGKAALVPMAMAAD
jgi:aryl sulfotransferase